MQQNPYQAPTSAEPYAAPGMQAVGYPQGWDVGEVIGLGWERVKEHWPLLIFAWFIPQLIAGAPGWVIEGMKESGTLSETTASLAGAVTSIFSFVVGAFLTTGVVRVFMKVGRGEPAEFGEIFGGGDRFGAMLGTLFLQQVAIVLGLVCLIIPGIILAVGLSWAPYYCADTRMGPVECLKASWEATNGQKMQLVLLGLLSVLVVLGGLLCLLIGVFPAVAVVNMALAYAYLRGSGRLGGGPQRGQPGAWGPQTQPAFGGPLPGGGWGGPPPGGGWGGPPQGGGPGGYGGPPQGGGSPGGWGGPPQGGGPGGYGGPPQGGGSPGGYGGPPQGGGGPPQGGGSPGGYGGPPQGGGGQPPPGWGGPPQGGGGQPPPGWG